MAIPPVGPTYLNNYVNPPTKTMQYENILGFSININYLFFQLDYWVNHEQQNTTTSHLTYMIQHSIKGCDEEENFVELAKSSFNVQNSCGSEGGKSGENFKGSLAFMLITNAVAESLSRYLIQHGKHYSIEEIFHKGVQPQHLQYLLRFSDSFLPSLREMTVASPDQNSTGLVDWSFDCGVMENIQFRRDTKEAVFNFLNKK